mmetsp:Transcript_52743/g.107591  ORF Transcript_52743/g.107591 Transcript_52743/m.107591 type:complete len:183 (-) Transcript_52743:81-629(-)|eukprot:CAMPEP_0181319004 /NCGR_PEP_ID=MMETSP1101-20121128/17324_1 /TAXON_ID=46948 /ORGANISM="Rhodomonas abbreviata, Strain Caron Lab Isolate" /LENGTH=182 /DNA_ID=CAMNT_0023426543 /DNA_START=62 /DNA_END=610 /DNA_ORIENTATION=+
MAYQKIGTRQERLQKMKRMMESRKPFHGSSSIVHVQESKILEPTSQSTNVNVVSRNDRQQEFARMMMARKPSRVSSSIVQVATNQEYENRQCPSIVNTAGITRHERQQEFARMMASRLSTLVAQDVGQKRAREEHARANMATIEEGVGKHIKKPSSSIALFNEQEQDNHNVIWDIASSITRV